ncbi:C3HC zinc finger-like-domain-containing protein [Exophiala viscosa]|uniref:C3HC zinc finger-like-domain-containing protein n=1 Tax=Exophiala viscosa TaxID=2486360 RepID=A0AAN6IA31_9EURO|nr:C3HC zinc finger-like-domain-containing protein [Exophiala viscosa]
MSYAIETKKRKFDRILEAINDGAASPSRTSLNSRNNGSTTTLSKATDSDSSKRLRVATSTKPIVSIPSTTSLSGHFLPSSRTAFLQRLETFRHVTQWHIPSTEPINAVVWAKRGWTCVDTDTVSCGACKERLHVDLDTDDFQGSKDDEEDKAAEEEDSFAMTTDLHDNMVKRYQGMIVTAHAESCLWRKRGCDSSIQRIEGLLNTSMAVAGLRTRYDSIMTRAEEVPDVAPLPATVFEGTGELEQFRFIENEKSNLNVLRLAVCGWERKCDDVVECHHCFRSLGLWLYRGETPIMESLDAVDDHLDYCPWRSATAQDTEVVIGGRKSDNESAPKSQRVPGWALVYKAVLKDSIKRKGQRPTTSASTSESEVLSTMSTNEPLTPEQRERKMRDLLRRIKEIKKPFNVKALLKRKDKNAA